MSQNGAQEGAKIEPKREPRRAQEGAKTEQKNEKTNEVNLGRVSVGLGRVEVSSSILLRGRCGREVETTTTPIGPKIASKQPQEETSRESAPLLRVDVAQGSS